VRDPQEQHSPLAPLCYSLAQATSANFTFALPPNYLAMDPPPAPGGSGVAQMFFHADVLRRSSLTLLCTSEPVAVEVPMVWG
jgi:hypothetical protein